MIATGIKNIFRLVVETLICGLFPHCREKYKDLLCKFNQLQIEKAAIQQKFEFGLSSVVAMKADMKVKIIQSGSMNIISEVVTNILILFI